MRIPQRWRRLHALYAALRGYFWRPCPRCGEFFGGHEADAHKFDRAVVLAPRVGKPAQVLCPKCAVEVYEATLRGEAFAHDVRPGARGQEV